MNTFGGPEVLELVELPEPLLGPDQVTLRVVGAGVNPVDWKIREGWLAQAFPHVFPVIPGWDVSGVVTRVGPTVQGYKLGDRVVGYVRKDWVQAGTYAELVTASPRHLAHVPDEVDLVAAAGLPLAGLTALQALRRAGISADSGSGDTVLVHAAAGGVGYFAVQLARRFGARVIGTASRHNHEFLRAHGVEGVTYGDDLVKLVRAISPTGVDAAVDFVGGQAVPQSFELLADPSRLVTVAAGPAALAGGGQHHFVVPDAAELATLIGLVASGDLIIEVAARFPLAQAAAAQTEVQANHVRGKVVIEVSEA